MNQPLKVPPARVVFSDADIQTITELVTSSLKSGSLTLGPHGREFERRFSAVAGRKHAVAVSSGTSALEIALRAIGVAGREVVVPANTFVATASAAVHAGASIRFADIERETLALDPRALPRVLSAKTAAVILVHIGGVVSPHTPEIVAICEARGIACVEDAAHAAGASLNDRPAGSFGVAGAFSLYPTKIITSGEGGMLVTDDDRIATEARIYLDQGKAGFTQNVHTRMGHNWRMSEPHAAIGLVHLGHLTEFVAERRKLAARYDAALAAGDSLRPCPVPAASRSNYYKYVAWLPDGVDRAAFKKRLREEHGVGLAGEVYELPLHLQPVFEGLAPRGSLPVAEEVCARHVCLPVYQGMSDAELDAVVQALRAAIARS
jgi:dTDP-4-amino-4,6-dideoxygalactose transaminase